MLDLETGRFYWGDGLELYLGMSREEFRKSKVFDTELLHPEDKEDEKCGTYDLRTQEIDGFRMDVSVEISILGYVEEIILSKPEYYNWPNWPEDRTEKEYALEILAYNDAFVRKQIEEGMAGKNIEIRSLRFFTSKWGAINSMCDLRDIPRVEVIIRYENFLFGRGL